MSAGDYIILALLGGVVVVLLAGVVNMMRGGDPRTSNKLMVLRVTLQGLVILLVALFMMKR